MWRTPPIEWSDKFSTTAVSIVNHEWVFKNLFFIFDPLIFISSPTCSFFWSNNIFCLFHLEPNRLLDHFPEIDSPSWLIRNSLWKLWSLPNSHQNTQNTHNMSLTLMIQKSYIPMLLMLRRGQRKVPWWVVDSSLKNRTSSVARFKIDKKRALRVITGWGRNRRQLPLTGDNSFNQVSRSTRR